MTGGAGESKRRARNDKGKKKKNNHATVAVTRSAQREEEFSVVGTENGLMEVKRIRFNRSGSWNWRRGGQMGAEA